MDIDVHWVNVYLQLECATDLWNAVMAVMRKTVGDMLVALVFVYVNAHLILQQHVCSTSHCIKVYFNVITKVLNRYI